MADINRREFLAHSSKMTAGLAAAGMLTSSTYAGNLSADFNRVVVDELTIVGSRCGPFQPAINILTQDIIDPRPLIEEIVPLSDALEAFNKMNGRSLRKIIIDCEK